MHLIEEEWLETARAFQEAWAFILAEGQDREKGNRLEMATKEPGDEDSRLLHLSPTWELKQSKPSLLRSQPYLSMRVALKQSEKGFAREADQTQAGLWTTDEEEEQTIVQSCSSQYKMYDFHIIYNSSFQVPELLCCGYDNNGCPLKLEEVLSDFATCTPYSREVLSSVFLEKEHPYLLLPWVGTHLCESADIVGLMMGKDTSLLLNRLPLNLKYMLAWWSSIGKYVAMHLPLDRIAKRLGSTSLQEDVETSIAI